LGKNCFSTLAEVAYAALSREQTENAWRILAIYSLTGCPKTEFRGCPVWRTSRWKKLKAIIIRNCNSIPGWIFVTG
jgi:hypothetical protein